MFFALTQTWVASPNPPPKQAPSPVYEKLVWLECAKGYLRELQSFVCCIISKNGLTGNWNGDPVPIYSRESPIKQWDLILSRQYIYFCVSFFLSFLTIKKEAETGQLYLFPPSDLSLFRHGVLDLKDLIEGHILFHWKQVGLFLKPLVLIKSIHWEWLGNKKQLLYF